MWNDLVTYLQNNTFDILVQVRDHLTVSLIALLIACAIGVPIGYFASESAKGERIMTIPFEVLRVVPSLAILVLLIPVLGTGTAPAAVALTILAVPPVLLNTIAGFRQVPDFMTECGRGIGLSERQVLWKVRVPLALPMIFAGIRTALIEVIASATLAAKIGAGGLGEIIFTGLGLNRADLLIIGGALVAALSLGSGFLFDLVTGYVLRYKRAAG